MQTKVVWTCLTFITILQGTVKGGRRQGRQRNRWEDYIREWTGLEFTKFQRAVENREKWRKLAAKSPVVPQQPSWLRGWWWWWWTLLILFPTSSSPYYPHPPTSTHPQHSTCSPVFHLPCQEQRVCDFQHGVRLHFTSWHWDHNDSVQTLRSQWQCADIEITMTVCRYWDHNDSVQTLRSQWQCTNVYKHWDHNDSVRVCVCVCVCCGVVVCVCLHDGQSLKYTTDYKPDKAILILDSFWSSAIDT